jgi:hypothetical protein
MVWLSSRPLLGNGTRKFHKRLRSADQAEAIFAVECFNQVHARLTALRIPGEPFSLFSK